MTLPIKIVDDAYYNSHPRLAQLADGTYICLYRKGTNKVTNSDGALVYRFSSDVGQAWSSETVFMSAASFDNQRVGIVAIGASKVLACYSQRTIATDVYGSFVAVGTVNDGRTSITWDTEVQIGSSSTTPYFCVCSQPLLLTNGAILVPVEYTDSGDTYASSGVISVTVSGTTPTMGSRVTIAQSTESEGFSQGTFVQLAGGRVVWLGCHDEGTKGYARSQSDDNGATWTEPTTVIPMVSGVLEQPSAVIRNASIWMIFRYSAGYIYHVKSLHDQGDQWGDPIFYEPYAAYSFNGAGIVLKSNNVIGFVTGSQGIDVSHSYLVYDEFPGSGDPFAAGYDPADNTVTRIIISDNPSYDYATNHTVGGENLLTADTTEGTDIYSVQTLVDNDNR